MKQDLKRIVNETKVRRLEWVPQDLGTEEKEHEKDLVNEVLNSYFVLEEPFDSAAVGSIDREKDLKFLL
ncbi:hypothetical protein C2G38_2168163 [Gigaspora rosea]|uniref:Uncharacterized protein n=1 Tax=Gigaspora rosea TaxID=44941 RepID=A0A397VZZ5_9GLOM|nr:hypothetical protein C2G38_2168163 [Gigaspora rosea]